MLRPIQSLSDHEAQHEQMGLARLTEGLISDIPDLPSRPAAGVFGVGHAYIVTPNYRIKCTSDNVTWVSHGYSDSITDRPSAAALGKGSWQVGPSIYTSNGIKYSNPTSTKKYLPSSYVAIKSATATVTGQSEKIASGVNFIYVKNLDATNAVKIGFGTDYATAESAAATSTDIGLPYLEFNFPVPSGMTHYSWLGVGGTVSAVIGQAE